MTYDLRIKTHTLDGIKNPYFNIVEINYPISHESSNSLVQAGFSVSLRLRGPPGRRARFRF